MKFFMKICSGVLDKTHRHLKENIDISEKKLKLQKNRYLAAKDMFDKGLFSPQDFIKVKRNIK